MLRNNILLALLCLGLLALAVHAAATVPAAGTQAPAFSLTSQEGNQVKLSDFKGKWVVLYFYPKDFTSGCTMEAHNFQHDLASYVKADAVILGVSVQDASSHKSFCAKEGLQFKLLADTDHKVSEEYGSLKDYHGMTLSARNTFIIDPNGKIVKVFEDVNPQGHSQEVLAALSGLQNQK